jgi:MYXO-CTERM domain-containing protein
MKRLFWAFTLVSLSFTSVGFGFCRATTCDPGDASQHCVVEPRTGCTISGTPLRWVSSCITVNVQSAGAPQAGVSADAAEASVRRALDTWLSADCGNGSPAIAVELGQRVSCSASEYRKDHHNANIVMFREGEWPYPAGEDALGVTRLRFDDDQAPGEIWDADIELNAVSEPLAVGQPKTGQVDLDSLLTHEVGHLLGLAHTLVEDGTMMAGYVKGSTELRTLASDDIAGICAIYPPGRELNQTSCEPRHGFSELCAAQQPAFVEPPADEESEPEKSKGCAQSGSAASSSSGFLAFLVAALLWQRRRRA